MTGTSKFRWNFRILDLAAGEGTTVYTIYALKEVGVFRGAKRKLKFGEATDDKIPKKCGRIDEINDLLGALAIIKGTEAEEGKDTRFCKRDEVKIYISNSRCGWHGSKRTPPKLKKSPNKSPKYTEMKLCASINAPGMQGETPRRATVAPKTARSNHSRISRSKNRTGTPSKVQSLISSYIHCIPRRRKDSLASNGNGDECLE